MQSAGIVMFALMAVAVCQKQGLMDYMYKNADQCKNTQGKRWLLVLNLGEAQVQCGAVQCKFMEEHCAMDDKNAMSCCPLPAECVTGYKATATTNGTATTAAGASSTTTTTTTTTAAPVAAAASGTVFQPIIIKLELNAVGTPVATTLAPATMAPVTQPPVTMAPATLAPTAAPTQAPVAKPTSCEDTNDSCCLWAKKGECDTNPYWMKPNCQKSCGTCGCTVKLDGDNCKTKLSTDKCKRSSMAQKLKASAEKLNVVVSAATTQAPAPAPAAVAQPVPVVKPTEVTQPSGCVDSDPVQCPLWAARGECEKNPFWMKPKCQKSCTSCGLGVDKINLPANAKPGCTNENTLCQYWDSIGECQKNPAYMNLNCKLACKQC